MTSTLLHHLVDAGARAWPAKPALSDSRRLVTHAELAAWTRELADLLYAAGLRRGDRMVIALPTGVLVPALAFAASRLGAAFSIVHEQVRGVPLDHVLDDCHPALVVSDDPTALHAARERGLGAIAPETLEDAGPTGPGPDGTRRPAPAPDRTEPLAVDALCLIYTSGTTSAPKAVVSTHAQALFALDAIQSVLRYRPDDTVYCPLPPSFDYGLYQVFLGVLSGAHVRLGDAADSGPALLRRLLECEATVLPLVPSLGDTLAWLLGRASGRRPPLRLLTNTGAALSAATLARLRETLPAARIHLMFGLTECKRATIMPADGDLERPGSCGLPLPGTEVVALDEDGGELPPGSVGELAVRGPNVMAGYWRRPELTARRFPRRHGLFPELRTGDYGWTDPDGYVYFDGRRDDLYKQRGFRVSATEVEAAARRVPGVAGAAVLPPADGHAAELVVVTALEPPEVIGLLREQIEPAKIPPRCTVVADLPLNGNGKVDRRALADRIGRRTDPADAN
ncbi:class I adenylate-forming enzyme family protein [Streptomyces spectabilis]|uniref:Acyl-CoA synthetase (AMP-forming)/AMP-acid ligase II n=1 Tax=Streptomyces spectabilis TaxID=68270 RepID=A0A5P2XPF2_STRST|nr:class I adenylate-forming enzyme family protein [Streptomyces spectabilis]MBB5108898.1 acyl-CoA synthetase (AMP-forming)/AMP-acid ligase II [Streptomyces spectabilis]MCI3899808.1 acyl--CoA ligase [Streptomyces spectabilis]QEV64386.1 long-chain fatty acid--CoA ligase [Streptomyces spectabilis]GGV42793.1 AMP-dependent synthetase and ligase [Streptomyces spectabilis]